MPMKHDFNTRQRQSLIGIVVLAADSLQSNVRALFPLFIVAVFNGEKKGFLLVLAGLLLVGGIIIGYLQYLNFTFYIDEATGEFVVKKGILSKTRIAIPLNRIQQVNINQNLLQRILKVHGLEVDTAGSGKTEVKIKAMSHTQAIALEERLLNYKAQQDYDATDETYTAKKQARPFIRISFLSLLKTGITSNYIRSIGLILAFFISTWQHLDDFLTFSHTDSSFLDEYISMDFLVRSIATITVFILFLMLAVNLGRTILKFFDFKVTKEDGTLLLSHGLINTRNTIIKPQRVQILTVGRNYFQKKFDITDLRIRQASDLEATKDRLKMMMEIPGLSTSEKDALLRFIYSEMPERGFEVLPNIRKAIFETFKFILLPFAVFYTYTFFVPEAKEALIFTPVYVLFAGILIYFAYRNSRLYVSPEFIIRQRGAWDVDNDILEPHKIQSVKLQQFFWQKWSDVGTVRLYTAGGQVNFGVARFSQLQKLANYWLYQVESGNKNWM